MIVVLVALAGALGAVVRFVVDSHVKSKLRTVFPWATVAINVTGSLILGFLAGIVLFGGGSGDVQTVIGTGFFGGYTTFSTASVETVRLVHSGRTALGLFQAVGTLVISVGACATGVWASGLL